MDDILERAWRKRTPPFNGHTVFLSQPVPLDNLIALLNPMVSALQVRYPHVRLRKVDDWHEHDGVVLEGSDIEWKDLRELLRSNSSFSQAVADDDLVRFGIYDTEGHFYLRFGLSSYDQPQNADATLGTFDFSATANLCESIKSLVAPAEVNVVPASVFFDKRYANASGP